MIPRTEFASPWSGLLKIISAVTTIIIVIVLGAVLQVLAGAKRVPFEHFREVISAVVLFAPSVALLLTVRGYTLEGSHLRVKRLLWSTELSLSGLKSVEFDPEAVKGSLRLFGNGGFFSFSGIFRNKTLGNYRAWATNHNNAVILRFDAKTWVVTPEDPERFVQLLQEHLVV
jgi:hypothetical protein